jgi:LysM repeat protein
MNQTYTVKPGDTLYGISNQYGVSVTELAELNGIKGSSLGVGTVLKIPVNSGTNPNNMFMYMVQKGDTLYSIATKYKTTPEKIINLNYLKNNTITPGQVLRIPEMYTPESEMMVPNYTNYIVKKGDTLYSIARANNISVDTLIKDNALTNNNLKIGQSLKIRIPTEEINVIEECYGPDYTPPVDTTPVVTTYTVVKGDSLYQIAKRFNTTASAIMNLNNLPNTNLSIGQKLKIPQSTQTNQPAQTYTVKSGDNLYSIARRFNTTVDAIKRKNNLTSNNLSIGQKLII